MPSCALTKQRASPSDTHHLRYRAQWHQGIFQERLPLCDTRREPEHQEYDHTDHTSSPPAPCRASTCPKSSFAITISQKNWQRKFLKRRLLSKADTTIGTKLVSLRGISSNGTQWKEPSLPIPNIQMATIWN